MSKISKQDKSAFWREKWIDFIAVIASIIAIVISICANRLSATANELSQSSNEIAIEANNLSSTTNEIATNANQTSDEALFNSRIVQPLTYKYYYEPNYNNLQKNSDCYFPVCEWTIKIFTGSPKQIVVIDSADDTIDYYDIYNMEPITDHSLKLDAPFTNGRVYNNKNYQYFFVYLEGVDRIWELDCIIHEYDPITKTSNFYEWNELDLLHLEDIERYDTLMTTILNEYDNLRKKIIAIKEY